MRFCVVRIWIVRVLKNTPDLHSAYYGFLAFSDRLYYSGTCVVRFYIVWFCIVRTFFGYLGRTMQGPTVFDDFRKLYSAPLLLYLSNPGLPKTKILGTHFCTKCC